MSQFSFDTMSSVFKKNLKDARDKALAKQVGEMKSEGLRLGEISRILGVSTSSITRALKDHGPKTKT